MELILSLTIGTLFAVGFFMLMNSGLLKMVFGFLLISQGANLFLFAVGGLTRGYVPILTDTEMLQQSPDPLSQALILTAIVIGFAATAFLVVLVRLSYEAANTDNYDHMREAEK